MSEASSNGSLSGIKEPASEIDEALKASSEDSKTPSPSKRSTSDAAILRYSATMATQASEHVFKTIKAGNPEYEQFADDARFQIMQALMDERLQYWGIFSKGWKPEEMIGGLTTSISTDMFYGIKRLWIYSHHIYPEFGLHISAWRSIIEGLNEYAKTNGCHEVAAFTADKSFARAGERFMDFKMQHFMTKEV